MQWIYDNLPLNLINTFIHNNVYVSNYIHEYLSEKCKILGLIFQFIIFYSLEITVKYKNQEVSIHLSLLTVLLHNSLNAPVFIPI